MTRLLIALLLLAPPPALACAQQVALQHVLNAETQLLVELTQELQTLPPLSAQERPNLRRQIRKAKERIAELSAQVRALQRAELAQNQADTREIGLGERAQDLIESEGWTLKDFRWHERHRRDLSNLDRNTASTLTIQAAHHAWAGPPAA